MHPTHIQGMLQVLQPVLKSSRKAEHLLNAYWHDRMALVWELHQVHRAANENKTVLTNDEARKILYALHHHHNPHYGVKWEDLTALILDSGFGRDITRRELQRFIQPGPNRHSETNQMNPPHEFKIMRVRECIAPSSEMIDTPERAAEYWRTNIPKADWFDPCKEAFIVLILNTRRRILGHNLVAIGSLDSVTVMPREVFAPILAMAGHAAILMHNHPSGDPSPSEADIKVTRDLIRAGQLLKIEILDHVIVGQDQHVSLRILGFFYS